MTGLGWPALPSALVDASVVAAIIALAALLAHRLNNPVKRMLSGFGDYLAWALTLLPLLTGYMAYHHLFVEYTLMLALHLFSVELLLVCLPFTKLFHTFSVFISRWYNGEIFGRKGVAS
jgi:nitrate reductase gamma subunit